jgi:mutator protein MutT
MNPRTGVYAIIKREHQILLVKQHKGPHRGKWDLPGGGLEMGETIEEALRRELREEVGLSFDTMELFDNFTAVTDWVNGEGRSSTFYQIGLIYLVEDYTFSEQSEVMEYAWLDLETLTPESISPFVRQILSR